MAAESAGGRKLAEAVADHVFRGEDLQELFAVVHLKGMPYHLGDDHRPSRPRLNRTLGAGVVHPLYLLQQVLIDERSLFYRPGHNYFFLRETMNLLEGLRLLRVRYPFDSWPQGDMG